MAIIKTDKTIAQLRKEFGEWAVFCRLKNGKIMMRTHGDYDSPKFKKMDKANVSRLKEANRMAHLILADPVKKAEYKAKCVKPKQSAYGMLLGELLINLIKMSHGNMV
jgi:hypothetical protein